MSSPALPPNVVARNDQDQAALADLTRLAHIHRTCTLPDVCAVDDITGTLVPWVERDLTTGRAVADLMRHARRLAHLLAVAALERSRLLSPAQILRLDVPAVPSPPGPVLSHEDTVAAIADHLDASGPDPRNSALIAALIVHIAQPSLGPDSECPNCEGAGTYFEVELGSTVHCHCACAWCVGCDEPVCDGPCETVDAIADALHIGASHG